MTASLLVSAVVWGCGSSGTGGTDVSEQPGPEDVRTLGITNCATCHGATPKTQDWLESRHANIEENFDGEDHSNRPDTDSATCLPCHDQLNDGLRMEQAFGVSNRNVVSCESCHGGGSAHRGIGPIPFPVPGPGQCGQCHGIQEALFHSTTANRIINDTHFDNPETSFIDDSTNVAIEGYNVKVDDQRGCQVCHFDGHRLDLEENLDWARSAHGGFILNVKDEASAQPDATVPDRVAAAVTDDAAAAWTHYNWDQTNDTVPGDRTARGSCQRCHTVTGAANFLNDPAAYDPANNDFSHLAGWTPESGSPQNEMLYCWGCHTEGVSLRNPGALTIPYTNTPGHTYPDARGSNVCLACHTGRESGDSIKNSPANFSDAAFINSHYLTAGGTVFTATGYEFEGRNYENPEEYVHDQLGMETTEIEEIDDNFTQGPCVTCHYSSLDGTHTLRPLTQYAEGDVALNPVCVNCHGARGQGSNAGPLWLEGTWQHRYQSALQALRVQLAANGFHFFEAHPYFFTAEVTDPAAPRTPVRNWLSEGDTDVTGGTTGKNNMGAAFNYNLLAHDPGGVAHNRFYTRRLIYDAIDWIDDGSMNFSVSDTLNALDAGAHPYKADAITYLIQGAGDGTENERF